MMTLMLALKPQSRILKLATINGARGIDNCASNSFRRGFNIVVADLVPKMYI
jgi:hypothetical protein